MDPTLIATIPPIAAALLLRVGERSGSAWGIAYPESGALTVGVFVELAMVLGLGAVVEG